MVGSKLMVLVYPLSMSFLPTQRDFCWMPNNPSCTECSAHPAESHCYPARRKSPLKVVAQCRTMSHYVAQCRTMSQDAQVNMCYNVNCQRRTRTQDAAQQQRKPSMGSSSSCRPLTKHRFTSNLVVAYDGILTLQYWESSVPWHESSP